ncbi:hypothetical protein J6590_010105 [Homalodisca vitripennis]|nr:hypothetical protein J6590_010105 [Homalodisca vitripennis]
MDDDVANYTCQLVNVKANNSVVASADFWVVGCIQKRAYSLPYHLSCLKDFNKYRSVGNLSESHFVSHICQFHCPVSVHSHHTSHYTFLFLCIANHHCRNPFGKVTVPHTLSHICQFHCPVSVHHPTHITQHTTPSYFYVSQPPLSQPIWQGKPFVKIQETVTVIEEEKLKLECIVLGKPAPTVEWRVEQRTKPAQHAHAIRKGLFAVLPKQCREQNNNAQRDREVPRAPVNGAETLGRDRMVPLSTEWNRTYDQSDGRVKLSTDPNKGIKNNILELEPVQMSDRGEIVCSGHNVATTIFDPNEAKVFVRVKDKYAALWPFLGICAEVIVLCAVIFIYEKKRNKAELEESDTDQSPEQ